MYLLRGSSSTKLIMSFGVHQGSFWGPAFLSIYVNGFDAEFNLHANTVIYCGGLTFAEAFGNLQKTF